MFIARAKNFLPWSTFGSQFGRLDREFGRFIGHGRQPVAEFPAFNVWSNDETAVITSELPGVRMEDLEITVTGNVIGIKGARKDEAPAESRYARRERPAGEFARSIELPFQIDASKVEAKLANGMLHIDLPRSETDKPRKITISAS